MAQRTGSLSLRRIRDLQDRAARAIPAAVQETRGGCWLRYSDSPATWWAGATLMHLGTPAGDLSSSIAAAEDFYAGHGAPARFQVCPGCPPDLDDALSRRRYERGGDVSLQTGTSGHIARTVSPPSLRVDLERDPSARWFDVSMAAQESATDRAAQWRLLRRVDGPSAYATAHVRGRPGAVGRAVGDSGWTGIFGMATLPEARHQGAATAVLAALVDWAGSQGFEHVYLQVTLRSAPALRLYRRSGFAEVCRYHYRVAAPSDGRGPGVGGW
jgi:N-acetylglutamate synthase